MDMVWLEKFLYEVRLMRQWQKAYFKTRSPTSFESAKEQEVRVDNLIAEYNGMGQGKLFEDDNNEEKAI
jgi:hypothetical protein